MEYLFLELVLRGTDYYFTSGNGQSTWAWDATNPFGTTAGADKEIIWDDGQAAITAPTVNSAQTFATTAAANTTVAISLSTAGSGGTLEYNVSTSTTTPTTGWQASSTVNVTRGTSYYFWARRSVSDVDRSDTILLCPYLLPDTAIAGTSSDISSVATSATTTVSLMARATDEVAVRLNNGSTNLGTRSGNGDITWTGSLPTGTSTTTYELFTRRPVSTGGDNLWDATDDTFTVTRLATATPAAPTDMTFVTATTASDSVVVTASASGGGTGTLEVGLDNVNWFVSGTNFGSRIRGTAHTWYARVNNGGTVSSSYSESHTPPYLLPDTAIAGTSSSISDTATSAVTTVSLMARSTDEVAVRINNGGTNLGTRSGNGDITWTGSLPTGTSTTTYELFTRRPVSTGGDNLWDATNDTFTVTRLAAGASADVTITISSIPAQGGDPVTWNVSSSRAGSTGNGATGTTTNPVALDFNEVVKFATNAQTQGNVTVQSFDAGEWTNTSSITLVGPSDNANKTRPASGITPLEQDAIGIIGASSTTFYFTQKASDADASITFPSVINMEDVDTSYNVAIGARGSNAFQSTTVYEIRDSSNTSTLRGSRTGVGTINVTTSFPQFLGIGIEKSIYCRLPIANGGDNVLRPVKDADDNNVYTLYQGTAPGANVPTEDSYGMAIYDHSGDLVTCFQEGHTVLRETFNGTIQTSTTAFVDLQTNLTGVNSSNSIIFINGVAGAAGGGSAYAVNAATRFSGTNVRIARQPSVYTAEVSVMQYVGASLNDTADPYGMEVYNANGDLVLDDLAPTYALKEIIDINPTTPGGLGGTTVTVYTNFNGLTNYAYIELAAGRYPISGGLPIPAVACTTGNAALMAPRIAGTSGSDYRYVVVAMSKNATTTDFKLAMLVEKSSSTPSYYGGSASDYGIQLFDSSGGLNFDSGWRQAIVQNVISANQFTSGGLNQNGSYDVETGWDGVTVPLSQGSGTPEALSQIRSTSTSVSLTGLNSMDPTNTFLLGGFVAGNIQYYSQPYYQDQNQIGVGGGGKHVPAISITGNTTATLSMFRLQDGPTTSTPAEYGGRLATSYHAHGDFVLARIT